LLKDKLACHAVAQSGHGIVKFLLFYFVLIASDYCTAFDIAADVDVGGIPK